MASRALWAAVILTLLSAAPRPAANFNAFGIAALKTLVAQKRSGNVFISPASIGVALAMAADGSAGQTRAEFVRTLQAGSNLSGAAAALTKELEGNPDARVGIADAIWTRADIPPNPAYAALLKERYGATAQALRFGDPSAAQTINDWTSTHTLGRISHLIDATGAEDFAYLTNALSFEGTWTLPFAKEKTHAAPFTPANGAPHSVQMMTRTAGFATVSASTYRALRMPYGRGGYAAYILLPQARDGADELVQQLTAPGLDWLAAEMQPELLSVSVPRFTATFKSSLNSTLQSLGVRSAFSFAADFSPMRKPPPRIFLSTVNHAAYVRVDEQGTVAAAATSAGMSITAIVVPSTPPFVVDHPFVFAIRDERSGDLLFLGVIRDV